MLEECQGQRHPNRREAPAEADAQGQAGNSRDQPLSYAKLSENAEAMTYFTGLRRGALDWLFPRLVAKVICRGERLFVLFVFVWLRAPATGLPLTPVVLMHYVGGRGTRNQPQNIVWPQED